MTKKQIQALYEISQGLCTAQYDAVNPTTRRSLVKTGLIEKDWSRRQLGGVEYLRLTASGKKVAAEVL
jgi:hypothetical protein